MRLADEQLPLEAANAEPVAELAAEVTDDGPRAAGGQTSATGESTS